MRRCVLVLVGAFAIAVLGTLFAVSWISVSALPEPGKVESYVAIRMKRLFVRRSSQGIVPPVMPDLQASTAEGEKLFGVDCAACHGMEGTKPSDAGRWMYPRAANLTAPEVQKYSDAELYCIVKNGIRMSGMPGFGKVETDANLWNLVQYVRSLRASQEQGNGQK